MAAMMRSLSSCLDATRMWRRTERTSLEKKPSTRFSQEPCLGVKVNSKRPGRAARRIGGIDQLEKVDELAASVAVHDQGLDLAGDEIDAGQQADRAVALVFELTHDGRVHAGRGRQVGSRGCDRLNAGLLVI